VIGDLAAVRFAVAEVPALAGQWSIEPLPGLTNRSYRLSRPGEALVLRLPGPDSGDIVHRSHEARNHATAAALGFAPALVHSAPSGLLVTRYLEGAATLDPRRAREPVVVAEVGKLFARLHRSGARFQGSRDPFENLGRYLALAGETAASELGRLRADAEPARIALAAAADAPAPCHIDPAPANILLVGEAMLLIDWEYSAMAEPSWDLADFAAEAGLDPDAMAHLLEAYGRRASAPERARLALWRLALDLLAAAWAQLRLSRASSRDLERLFSERKARAQTTIGRDLGDLLRDLSG
jgi:thiamine kinase-like enzyme